MLFHSSLRRELARVFGATLVILVTVVMTITLIRTLGQASRGGFAPADVTLVMGYTVLAYGPTLLTLSLFIAVMHTLARLYKDSEIVIWFSAGQGLAALVRPVVRFAWPVLAVVALLSLVVLPWSNQQIEALKTQYENRGDIDRVQPGQFQESANGSRVFFVDRDADPGGRGNNVFIATQEDGKETVTSARSGRLEQTEAGQYLILENGHRMERNLATAEVQTSRFQRYATRIGEPVVASATQLPINTLSTQVLLQQANPPAQAELSWRFGLIVAGINLLILAVALSGFNPRARRNLNGAMAVLTFITYFNLINLGQSWIASGKVSALAWMLALHGGVFVLSCLWLTRNHFSWRWSDLWQHRAPLGATAP